MRKLLTILLLLFACFVGTFAVHNVTATEELPYLSVSSSDFTVTETNSNNTRNYIITLTYSGDGDLPSNNNAYDASSVSVYASEEDTNELYLKSLTAKPKEIVVYLSKTNHSDGRLGYTEANPEIIRFEAPTVFTLSDISAGSYAGIRFEEGLTLTRATSEVEWAVAEASADEPPIEAYTETLKKENAVFAWLETENLFALEFTVAYVPEVTIEYEATFSVRQNNLVSVGEISVSQQAGENVVRCTFLPYSTDEEILSVVITDGEVRNSAYAVAFSLTETLSYYKYADGSWETEKYVRVRETVDGQTIEKKVLADGVYTLSKPELSTSKTFVGWIWNGALYAEGTAVNLETYTALSLDVEALYIGYALKRGASIRYDEVGTSSGIRFASVLQKDGYEKWQPYVKAIGVIVMPKDKITAEDFIWQNYNGDGKAKNFSVTADKIDFQSGTSFTLNASITEVLARNYHRAFAARAYLVLDFHGTETYLWEDYTEERTVYYVARQALQKGGLNDAQEKILQTYIDGVMVITYDGAQTVVESEKVSGAETTVSGKQATVRLTTEITGIGAVTYNGERITDYSQSYGDGVLTLVLQIGGAE